MSYDFYMGKILLPVAPKKLQLKVKGNNKTVTLINEGEVNILKTAGLTDIDFEILLPHKEVSYARYKSGFQPIEYYLSVFEKMKRNKEKFQFIVSRKLPGGKSMYGTNMKVSLEDYTIKEDSDDAFDTTVSIKLKQYRDYGTKKYVVFASGNTASENKTRSTSENTPSVTTYTVKSGDSLWKISASLLGDGSKWNSIYEANTSVIGGNPNLIYPGQVLTIPS